MKTTDFEAAPMWSTLDALSEFTLQDLGAETEEERDAVARLGAVVEYLDAFRSCDPRLVEPQGPADVYQHLTAMQNSLTHYQADREANRAHLAAAATNNPNLMNALRSYFPYPGADTATQATKAAATRFRHALEEQVETLKTTISDLRGQLDQEQTAHREAQAAAVAQLEELKTQIAAGEATIAAAGAAFETQTAEQQAAFTAEVTSRGNALKLSEAERASTQEERLAALEKSAAEARNAEAAEAEGVLAQLREYEEQAKAVIDSTSRHAVSGEYGTWAAHQARSAFWWTIAAVLIGVGTVVGLILAVSSAKDDTVQFVIYKVSIGLLAAAVAGYAAKQASEHRVQERRFKRLALDVAALEPFLATLEDATTIRDEFAKRVFAPENSQGDEGVSDSSGAVQLSASQILDLLKGLGKN